MPDIGPFSFTGIAAVGDASRSGTLSIKRSSVNVTVRSVEHECIAFTEMSRLIPIIEQVSRCIQITPPPYMLNPHLFL